MYPNRKRSRLTKRKQKKNSKLSNNGSMQGIGSVSSIKAKALQVQVTHNTLQTFQRSISDLLVIAAIGCSGGASFIVIK